MKWRKETKAYMWANYYSEDGNWKAWDEDITIKGAGRKKYNPETNTFVKSDVVKLIWFIQNLRTGETVEGFKTLKSAKEYAESKNL